MGPSAYWLAQVNVARMRAPLDSPLMAGFVARLEEINALADRSPGFVWRLESEQGDATAVRAFADDRILINLSVWESLDALRDYVYRSGHAAVMRQRQDWFERYDGPYLALWWVPRGHQPAVEEAVARLEHLRQHGDSPHAFGFKQPHPAPDQDGPMPEPSPRDTCPA